jgi:hypothetical protein
MNRSADPPRPRGWRRLLQAPVIGAVALLLLVAGLVMYQPWASNADTSSGKTRDAFAADREGPAPAVPIAFDAKRAMGYLEAICKIGPRISGSAGMTKQQQLLEKHFKAHGGKVSYQRFTAKQRSVRTPVEMANLIVSYHPERKRRVILCSHYDTRPIADQEPNQRRWREPFLSANDGGSGVALLMELAHHMKGLKTAVGVDLVFFDGEEFIHDPKADEYFFGSKHFAREYAKVRKKTTYTGAILFDMIAGKGARFPVEQNSWDRAEKLVRAVWGIARELECSAFKESFSKFPVEDDHLALNRAGIPAIDIIDFDYPHWHRLTDVPKNCSGETMAKVARVCGVWLERQK